MKKLLILLVLSLFLLTACNQTSNEHVDDHYDDGHSHEEDEDHEEEFEYTDEKKEFTMVARKWEFEPSEIKVNLGDLVDIHITSEDVTHGFFIPEFGINKMLEPGVEVDIDFVADKKGEFSFFCNVPCGRGHSSMTGVLIVE